MQWIGPFSHTLKVYIAINVCRKWVKLIICASRCRFSICWCLNNHKLIYVFIYIYIFYHLCIFCSLQREAETRERRIEITKHSSAQAITFSCFQKIGQLKSAWSFHDGAAEFGFSYTRQTPSVITSGEAAVYFSSLTAKTDWDANKDISPCQRQFRFSCTAKMYLKTTTTINN